MKHINFNALALVLLLPLAACGPSDSASTDTDHTASATSNAAEPTQSFIGAEVQKGMQKAKQELATKNISINSVGVHVHGERRDDDDSRPKAEITPQGDLLIAGKEVAATPAQHALLLDYRQQIVGIAETGMDIGTQGADLGINAAKQAMWGALSGKSDKDIEAAIKPQTDKIEASAAKLCLRLPDLLSTQQKLAAAMPEFRPYATMQQKDVDDCGKDKKDKDDKKGVEVISD